MCFYQVFEDSVRVLGAYASDVERWVQVDSCGVARETTVSHKLAINDQFSVRAAAAYVHLMPLTVVVHVVRLQYGWSVTATIRIYNLDKRKRNF